MTAATPRALVVVAGTATEVGKTWASVELIRRVRAGGWTVAARKPAQSGLPGEVSDADLLAGVTDDPVDAICPPHRRYDVAMAPPMAAEVLGLEPPTLAALVAEVSGSWGGQAADLGLVELAGGVASPIAIDADGADLAAALAPTAVVLVADAGLGTINAVRLSAARLVSLGLPAPVVFLNRFDESVLLHRANREWLAARDRFEVVTDVDALAAWSTALVPRHCASCGRSADDCSGGCTDDLDPDRYCERCGRRMVVTVAPTTVTSRCKVHGAPNGGRR